MNIVSTQKLHLNNIKNTKDFFQLNGKFNKGGLDSKLDLIKLITENKSKSDELTISKNKYNLFKNINVTNEDMARNYLNDYINKALNYPELAYNLLDEEYKNKRFGNLEEYKNNISLLDSGI